jgi:hypothetical protein
VLHEDPPELPDNFRADLMATAERIVWYGHPKRPEGID